jgi:hypothetical protein
MVKSSASSSKPSPKHLRQRACTSSSETCDGCGLFCWPSPTPFPVAFLDLIAEAPFSGVPWRAGLAVALQVGGNLLLELSDAGARDPLTATADERGAGCRCFSGWRATPPADRPRALPIRRSDPVTRSNRISCDCRHSVFPPRWASSYRERDLRYSAMARFGKREIHP